MDKKNIKKIAVLSILGLMASGCMNSGTSSSSTENTSSTPAQVTSSSSVKTSSTIIPTISSSTTKVVTLSSIEVTGDYKTQYLIGDRLDLTGVKLLVTYSDNSTELVTVTENMITPVDMATEGMKTVTITYEGLTTSFYIFVNAPEIEKVDPEVTISIENGATLVIGKDAAPTATVPEGLNYVTYYEQDGVFVSDTLPTTPGTYSFIVEVEENAEYNAVRLWRWFYLVEDKKTPEVEFSFENGATFTIGDEEPTVTVTEGLDYTVHYEKDEAFYSNTFPTEEGTYAMIVNVEGNAEYNARKVWRVFNVVAPSAVEKVDPEVTISIENGATLVIGKDAAPTVTLPEGLNYVTYYEQDGVKVSDTLPTTPGTYSFIVEVEGNDQYNSVRLWRWFYLVEDKKTPEVEFSFEAGAEFVLGVDAEPTVTVTEGLNYTVHYEKNEAFYSNTFPTEEGTYAMIVNVEGNAEYNARKVWRVFKVVAPTVVEKVDPEVTISIENGATLVIGKDAAPTVTLPEGLNYVTYYEQNEVKVSDTLPTTPGTYSFIVEVEGNDQYNPVRLWRWFNLVEDKKTPEVEFSFETGAEFVLGVDAEPTVTVTEGLNYTVHYEKNEAFYSNTFPTEAGTYAMIVEVEGNDQYNSHKVWAVFTLVESGEATA